MDSRANHPDDGIPAQCVKEVIMPATFVNKLWEPDNTILFVNIVDLQKAVCYPVIEYPISSASNQRDC